jgi:hypothetical protein
MMRQISGERKGLGCGSQNWDKLAGQPRYAEKLRSRPGGSLTLNTASKDPAALWQAPRARSPTSSGSDVSHDSNTDVSDQPSGVVQFGRIQRSIALDRTLPRDVKVVYSVLSVYANKQRICWPSRETIALDASISVSAVSRALRHAAKVGILTVIHTQTSNRYQLHDMEVGGYIPGEIDPAGHADLPGESGRPSGQVTQTHKQDHTTRPAIQTISTSSDAVTANPQRTSSSGNMKIMISDDYWTTDKGHMMQTLAAALIRTLEHAKLELRPEGRDRIRELLKRHAAEGNHRQMLGYVQHWVSREDQWSWFAYLPESRAA